MDVVRDRPLAGLNTFGLPATARWFAEVRTPADLAEALSFARRQGLPVLPLGGGSNLVLAGDPDALVVRLAIAGFEILDGDRSGVRVRVGAGEPWPGLVDRCLAEGLYGLENLVSIPGTAGAAPIQNIGAYGVEVGRVLDEVEALDVATGEVRTFPNGACGFGYRTSVFKTALRDRCVVASITLRLSRQPRVDASYGALAAELRSRGRTDPSPLDVADAIRDLRRARLPDPAAAGNAGSFFENPIVDAAVAARLAGANPGLPVFPAADGTAKLAAAWLIERCGFRGARRGAAGVHPGHALVLVNLGGATGRDVLALADEIRGAVRDRFGVDLAIEPRVVGAGR